MEIRAKVGNVRLTRIFMVTLFIGSVFASSSVSYFVNHLSKKHNQQQSYLTTLKRFLGDFNALHSQVDWHQKMKKNMKAEEEKNSWQELNTKREMLSKNFKAFLKGDEHLRLALQVEKMSQEVFDVLNAKPEKGQRAIASTVPTYEKNNVQLQLLSKKLTENVNSRLIFAGETLPNRLRMLSVLNLVMATLGAFAGIAFYRRLHRAEQALFTRKRA